jgi:predicted dehydrogenase
MTLPLRIALLGAGGRGSQAYGIPLLRMTDRARIVAVAEHDPTRRDALADAAGIPAAQRYRDWEDLVAAHAPAELDAVVITLPDHAHVDPTLACAAKGWPILLEKPIAPGESELLRLQEGLAGTDPDITVCHVLRYTPFWRTVVDVVRSGALGEMITIQHEENIGYWHFAHSYVRGNWRREELSSPMALAKTSHDFDLIRWIAGQEPVSISSSGSLHHFHEGNAPPGAPSHCLDGCPVADTCAFYAPRYYVDALGEEHGWPVALLGSDTSREGRLRALQDGPYGRCVYRSDNDVVDHQQTVMTFPSGLTATLTTSAFTAMNTRTFRITGSRGMLTGRMDSGELRLDQFTPGAQPPAVAGVPEAHTGTDGPLSHPYVEWTATPPASREGYSSHAGGDPALIETWISGLEAGRRGETTVDADASSFAASMDSHLMAFAAERARLDSRVVDFAEMR